VRLALALLAIAACSGAQKAPGRVGDDDAVFYLRSNVGDANVYVDGRFVGPVSNLRGGIAIAAGKHRLELRREDYFSRYVELELAKGARTKLLVELAPVLP